jgi:F-box and WD-40 domain protein CDC4
MINDKEAPSSQPPLLRSPWLSATPEPLHFPVHIKGTPSASVITCLLLSRERVISASDDHWICVWDPTDGRQIHVLEGHDGGIWSLAACSRRITSKYPLAPPKYQDLLVSGSTDRTLRVWDLETGRNTYTFGGHTSTVRSIAIVRPTWVDKDDGSGLKEKRPKQTLIITGSRDHTLRVWRLPTRSDVEYNTFSSDTAESDDAQVGLLF